MDRLDRWSAAVRVCISTNSTSPGQWHEKNCRYSHRNNRHGFSPSADQRFGVSWTGGLGYRSRSIQPAINEFERLGVGILDPVKSPGTPHSERSTRFPLSNHAVGSRSSNTAAGHEAWGLCNDHLLFHRSHNVRPDFCYCHAATTCKGGRYECLDS